jgi:hypothetical protein
MVFAPREVIVDSDLSELHVKVTAILLWLSVMLFT